MARLAYAAVAGIAAALLLARVGALADDALDTFLPPRPATEAICDTDTDCMRFCQPPADDPDCDGGPQTLEHAALHGRGNYGSQP